MNLYIIDSEKNHEVLKAKNIIQDQRTCEKRTKNIDKKWFNMGYIEGYKEFFK